MKALVEEKNHFRNIMDGKRKEIEPLQQALGKLRGPRDANKDNRSFICSSEAELNDVVSAIFIIHEIHFGGDKTLNTLFFFYKCSFLTSYAD